MKKGLGILLFVLIVVGCLVLMNCWQDLGSGGVQTLCTVLFVLYLGVLVLGGGNKKE